MKSLFQSRRLARHFRKNIIQCANTTSGQSKLPFPFQQLESVCPCGKTQVTAKGSSVMNCYCHSEAVRSISKQEKSHLCAFKPSQLVFNPTNPIVRKKDSYGLEHLYCSCDKQVYLGTDYTKSLGTISLFIPSFLQSKLSAEYQPNHHFYYSQRVKDSSDQIPKWQTIIDGDIVLETNQSSIKLDEMITGTPSLYNTRTGQFQKDVFPLSPLVFPEPREYIHTEQEIPISNTTKITSEKIVERVQRKYIQPVPGAYVSPKKTKRDVIVIGGGHNGLITAAYLAKKGKDVLLLERRHCLGGAAITEEIIPGFHFSRASYLAGLLRPQIIAELSLEKYGFEYLPRSPSSFTPTKADSIYQGKYLLLGGSSEEDRQSIAQFSSRDAEAYFHYEEFLNAVREIMSPLLDSPPINPFDAKNNWRNVWEYNHSLLQVVKAGWKHQQVLLPFYELFTGPAQQLLDRWFESDILKTTLATDAVIGACISPKQNGSAYVLLHHVMGEAAGKKGVWAYVRGGMGAVSQSIAASAREAGAELVTNAVVRKILVEKEREVKGVLMDDGSVLEAQTIISGTTPYHTFVELMPEWTKGYAQNSLLNQFTHHLRHTDFSCGAFKINCAVDRLPNFTCFPSPTSGEAGPMHRGTVHFEYHMDDLEFAYREASLGIPATRPVVEMTIPSSIDSTLAPPGKHVVQLFVQYAPYDVNPKIGSWADPVFKDAFVERCFAVIEGFCPGFRQSIIGYDALSPLDLERIFGLHRGSISHSALGLHQLAYARPMAGFSDHRTPIKGLYLCSAGTHPGGGVIGAGGRNCANIVMSDLR